MLSLAGYLTVVVLLVVMLGRLASPVLALTLVPVVSAMLLGYSLDEIGGFAISGFETIVPIVALFVFSIVFFGVMSDAGVFDPIVDRLVSFAGGNPVTVALATAMLAMVSHLDGAGATSILITVPAMLPIYQRLGMRKEVLAGLTAMGIGVMNVVPWGGPTARAGAALGVDPNTLWVPVIPAQVAGIVAFLGVAYYFGKREARRLRISASSSSDTDEQVHAEDPTTGGASHESPRDERGNPEPASSAGRQGEAAELARPGRYWFNLAVIVLAVVALVMELLPSALVFMLALVAALLINYPNVAMQRERIDAHASGAIMMASILLAAGVFIGVMDESGMLESMAVTAAQAIPSGLIGGLPLLVGILGMPVGVAFSPDAYYFGVLPVLVEVAEGFGISGTAIAQASILAEDTVQAMFSPYNGAAWLLLGLSQVEIANHFRTSFLWAWALSLVMLVVAVAIGVIPLWAA